MTEQIKFSEMPPLTAGTLDGTEVVPMVRAGVNRRATIADILSSALFKLPIVGAVFRSLTSKLGDTVSLKDFGAVGDFVTNDTAALQAASLSGRRVLIPRGQFRATAAVSFQSGTVFEGEGEGSELVLDYVGASQNFLTATGKTGVVIRNLKVDGGRDATHAAGWPVLFDGCTDCHVDTVTFVNAPSETVLVRNSSSRCTVKRSRFAIQGQGTAHIYFLNSVDRCEATSNYFENSVGGCIWASGSVTNTTIIDNECAQSAFELIGIRYDCVGGTIAHNRAQQTGDNGISVTGTGFTVIGNKCWENGHNGIGVYGQGNTVCDNECYDNGNTTANTYAGIIMSANFGGLCQNNVVANNAIFRKNGTTTEQYYGINVEGTAYTLWAAGQAATIGLFRYYQSRLYVATTAGTTGATPPTHSSGAVSDGAVSWAYVGLFDNVAAVPAGNRIGPNKIQPHLGGDVRELTNRPNGYDEESLKVSTFRVPTAWATGVAKTAGDYVFNVHADGAPRCYRAVNSGTTGATPPTHGSGSASDGTVTWQFVEVGSIIKLIESSLARQVFAGPLLVQSLDSPANPVGIYAASTNPEGTIAARNGSLYMRDNATLGIEIFVKTGTTGATTGWLPLHQRRSGTTAQRPTTITQIGVEYYDTTLNKPVWSTGTANQYRDATGTVV